MFLRCHKRKKNGKLHQYYSVVENRRIANGRVSQKTVLYLGEITNDQEKAWRKTLQVFDVDQNKPVYKYLFATEVEAQCSRLDESIRIGDILQDPIIGCLHPNTGQSHTPSTTLYRT